MNLKTLFTRFKTEEDGAVTVDWVVLTAALVGLAVGLLGTISSNTTTVADNIATKITEGGAAIAPAS